MFPKHSHSYFLTMLFLFPFSAINAAPDNGSVIHEGQATYYAATGGGNCSFDASAENALLVGAMNELDYDNSTVCGSFVNVTGPNGSVTIRIVDRCPECPVGHIDLSPDAFEAISPLSAGLIDISWTFVPGEVEGPISYKFNNGSNEWWTSIQIRNHRTSVASVEIKDQSGEWAMLDRQMDNFFSNGSGYGMGPYTIRVTDIFGQQLTDEDIPFSIGGVAEGSENFPSPLAVKRFIQPHTKQEKLSGMFNPQTIANTKGSISVNSVRLYNPRGRAVKTGLGIPNAAGLYIIAPDRIAEKKTD